MSIDQNMPVQNQNTNTICFSGDNFSKILETMYEHHVAEGSYLFWEGDAADKLYFIKKGRIKITKSTDDGKQLTLYIYQEGDLFGQMDPFGNSIHSFNAEVTEDSSVGIIQQRDLETLLWQHGDLAVEFMKWMGLMHRLTQTKFRDLMMFGKPGALCSTLIRLNNSYGKDAGSHRIIDKKITNTDLAEMISATRESVNRMLHDLKNMEVIALDKGYIVIKDLNYLRDLCHCEDCPGSICRV